MTRHHLFTLLVLLASTAILAGCGVNAHPTASAGAHQLHPSPSASPTTAVSTPAPRSTAHSVPSSPANQASSTAPTTSINPSNAVVMNALQQIQARTRMALGVPAQLPSAPTPEGYLTATTTADANRWSIALLETQQPEAVNSPGIGPQTLLGEVASWGQMALSSVPRSPTLVLQAENPLWNLQAAINAHAPHQATYVGTAQDGRPATVYPVTGSQWPNTKLVFTEGAWTVELVGSNAQSEEQAAYTIADNLHFQMLPPGPGLMLVVMTAPSSSQTVSTAVAGTALDWLQDLTITWVSAPRASRNNSEEAIRLATSWRSWSG